MRVGRHGWTFFLQGVRDTANQAARTATNIDKLFRTDKEKIEHFGRGAASAMLIYRHAQVNPLFSIKSAAREMKVSFPTASAALARMLEAGMLRESSGKRRDRLFFTQNIWMYSTMISDTTGSAGFGTSCPGRYETR